MSGFFCRVAHWRSYERFFSTPFSTQVTGRAGRPSTPIGDCRRMGLPTSLLIVMASLNTFSPSFVVPVSLPVKYVRANGPSADRALKRPVINDRKRALARGSRMTV